MDSRWNGIKKKYNLGDILEGKIIQHRPFGIFLDIGEGSIRGLVRITNFTDGIMSPKLYPPLGTIIKGVIVEISDHNHQINISLKPSDLNKWKKTD